MFGISLPELVIIFVVALLAFGPEKLPEVARWLGKTSADLRRASEGLRREFYRAVYEPSKEDLERAQRVLTVAKEFAPEKFEPDPLCPDSQRRNDSGSQPISDALQSGLTESVLPTAAESSPVSKTGEPVEDGSNPQAHAAKASPGPEGGTS